MMANQQHDMECDIGIVGLGVMGRNFSANIADHHFAVVGYDRDEDKLRALQKEKQERHNIRIAARLEELVRELRRPRAVLMLVPAGSPVDAVIGDLQPMLEPGDLIIDSGNSRFTDTDRRSRSLSRSGLHFMGMGISGGESGARHGPSLMPGGPREAYERVRPIMEAAAAHVDGDPCVAYLGPGSAGHYVKMVHNGIEYGIMQLIAETYDLMKRGLGMTPDALHAVYERWNREELNSYLMEITADIFLRKDDPKGSALIDLIRDEAKQKGTGEWTAWDALDLRSSAFNIQIAVLMRDMSAGKQERRQAERILTGPEHRFRQDEKAFVQQLKSALRAAMIITYAQGMALLRKASQAYDYRLDLETVARIWRGGCIIRAALLEDIRAAFRSKPDLANMLLDRRLGEEVTGRQEDLRRIVQTGVSLGLPVPGLMMALAYFDAYRSGWLPANLIMAQRDYFGSHGYERVDAAGVFHTQWASS
jgi:6-phosphogluconate dehydrogenase